MLKENKELRIIALCTIMFICAMGVVAFDKFLKAQVEIAKIQCGVK